MNLGKKLLAGSSIFILLTTSFSATSFAQEVQELSEIKANKKLGIKKKVQLMNYYPNSQTRIDTVLVRHFNEGGYIYKQDGYVNGIVQNITTYKYSGKRIIETIVTYQTNNNRSKTAYEYNSFGKIAKMKWFNAADVLTGEYRYHYDKNGNQLSRIQYNGNNRSNYSEHYRYDSKNRQYYRCGTNYNSDTTYRVTKTWKNDLLRETKFVYPNNYSNSTIKEHYTKEGLHIGTTTKTQQALTDLKVTYDEAGNIASQTVFNSNTNGYNNSKTMKTFKYDQDKNVVVQTDYSNASNLKSSVYYTWRGDELIEKRSMKGGAYAGAIKSEDFASLNMKIDYNYNYQTASIDFISQQFFNDKKQLIRKVEFRPEVMLKNIFDMKLPTKSDQTIYEYNDDIVDLFRRVEGWGLKEEIKLKKDTENPIYRFLEKDGKKFCLVHVATKEYNNQDSLISVMTLNETRNNPKLELSYTANYDGLLKSKEKEWKNGKIIKQSQFTYLKDTTVQKVSVTGQEKVEVVFVYQDNRVVKSYQKGDLEGCEGMSWDYTYDENGHLTYKVETAMSPTLETYNSIVFFADKVGL